MTKDNIINSFAQKKKFDKLFSFVLLGVIAITCVGLIISINYIVSHQYLDPNSKIIFLFLIPVIIIISIACVIINRKTKKYIIKCNLCEHQFSEDDLKIIIASHNCPYCGKKIID